MYLLNLFLVYEENIVNKKQSQIRLFLLFLMSNLEFNLILISFEII